MKIILSPSKTQNEELTLPFYSDIPLLNHKATLSLFKTLKKMSPVQLGEAMDIKGKLLDKTVKLYQDFDPKTTPTVSAIALYTGVVFDQLTLAAYDEKQNDYINDHVRILSAMYGLLHPRSAIWPYRLDFTMKLPSLKLKILWSPRIVKALKSENLILDLSSQEYGALLKPLSSKIHQIIFLELIDGQEKIISTNAKKARGKMAHYLIHNRITDIKDLAGFSEDGYCFQTVRSNQNRSVFIKKSDSTLF